MFSSPARGEPVTHDEDQTIPYPGYTDAMSEQPRDSMRDYVGRGLLQGRRALITGGDSGIGRAVAVVFAKEGADVAIAYLSEDDDARRTVELVEAEGRRGVAYRVISPTGTRAPKWSNAP